MSPQQVWCRAAGPRIVATSTNPRFGSHQGPSPAGRSSSPSGRSRQWSRSMIGSQGWTCIVTTSWRASAGLGRAVAGSSREGAVHDHDGRAAVLKEWLADRQVQLVAMEATGVYWKPVLLRAGGAVHVVAVQRAARQEGPGPQDRLCDAEWLADVAAHGMVRPSFVPPPPIRELRELTRYRKTQIDARAPRSNAWRRSSKTRGSS